ncbi:hypothetical protein GLV94_02970 [Virgibacillus halodenitrificans]|uniref:hypothetical protein n=1 Tax=Virgibacillus halodenitrificans TaxID=1482 RepID=UPI001369EF89|nr:hypothetical protein [Virgibacillus halodenitrificans]MYL44595.1 hypothetical protein [Virgibacillus halodenitrificans]
MLKRLITWFISLFERGLSTITKEERKPLKLDLQYFAKDEDPEDDLEEDPEDDGPEDDAPNLDELLKDKKFKKQYQDKMKQQLSKRMKKYKDIDPEEYRRLKEQADKKKDKKDKDEDDELETLRNQLTEKEKRIERAERKEKRAMVKEFAVDNQVNPKLLARLINVDDIELDEDGAPENLDDLFEDLEEEFPEYFGASDDEDDEEEKTKKKSKHSYIPGSKQKRNKTKKIDPYEAGKTKAMERHKKEEK